MNNTELCFQIGQQLQQKIWRLVTAESCSGGGLAHALTEIPGASSWFECGFIPYSNQAKTSLLAVPTTLLEQYGSVSEQVAAALATGALAHSKAQVAVSTTGIAGPGGAVPGKPVGTVCFGWAFNIKPAEKGKEAQTEDVKVETEQRLFTGDRQAVRQQTVVYALQGLLRFLNKI